MIFMFFCAVFVFLERRIMDKFGIFKILNSLTGLLGGNYEGLPALPSRPQETAEDAWAKQRANTPPLQNSMLSTMKSHDEFVKRVLKENR